MKQLFGGSESKQSSASGFGALPPWAQQRYKNLAEASDVLLESPGQFFSPMGITGQEEQALGLIQAFQDPSQFRANIETFMNPFRDILTQDINKAFEGPTSALQSRASEAGAFGGSRFRSGQTDLERARLDAIQRGLAEQYGTALGQQQTTIQNLLGFGGLERGVDLAQRMAPVQGMQAFQSFLNPLLAGSASSGKTSSTSGIGGTFSSLFPGGV